MKEESNMNLLFEPRSIAVVGASSKPGKIGFSVVRNLNRAVSRERYTPSIPRAARYSASRCSAA